MGRMFVPGCFESHKEATDYAMSMNQMGASRAPIYFPVQRGNAWFVMKVTGETEAGVSKLHKARMRQKLKIPRRRK